jgi:hypothetical protein
MASRRWYCIHCGQVFVSSDIDTCSLCRKSGGLVDPEDPTALRDLVRKKQQNEVNPNSVGECVAKGLTNALFIRRILRCSVGGILLLLLAGLLLLHPDLRSDPRGISFSDFGIAIGPLLAGTFLLLLAVVNWRGLRSYVLAAKEQQQSP